MKPLDMQEVVEIIGDREDKKDVIGFVKKFSKIKLEAARKLKAELESLGIVKMSEKDVAKVIDFLPEDASDINKIFTDISLDEDETNKILEVVKKYR